MDVDRSKVANFVFKKVHSMVTNSKWPLFAKNMRQTLITCWSPFQVGQASPYIRVEKPFKFTQTFDNYLWLVMVLLESFKTLDQSQSLWKCLCFPQFLLQCRPHRPLESTHFYSSISGFKSW
jgi:hypothetical protein